MLICEIINVWFRSQVKQILKFSFNRGVAPSIVAEEIAMKRFIKMKAKYERSVVRKIYNLLTNEIIPEINRKLFLRMF